MTPYLVEPMTTRPIGVVPAGGVGSRLSRYRGPKELIQVGYQDVGGQLLPKAAVEHVLEAMRCGGVADAMLVLSPAKAEVFRYLGSGQQLGLKLAYLCQEQALGIPHALDLAAPYVSDATVCMGMPDTIFTPQDSFAQLLQFHHDHHSDLSLGVFPTTEPQSLAPVVIEPGSHRVREIVDKPANPPVANTWGIAVWSPAFTELLGGFVRAAFGSLTGELLLSEAFMAAVRSGLRVHALSFEAGEFYDIGTPGGVVRARQWLESSDRLVAGWRG
jgi:glucose-1-phosphate thymidylyltransferase